MNGPRAASARAGGKAPPNVWEEPDDMWYVTGATARPRST